jgi:nitrite reductase (NADH) large subunit
MAGGNETYAGTVPSTSLKVAGIHLTSMGDILVEDKTVEQVKVKNPDKNIYKKVLTKDGRIIGAIFLGDTKNAYETGQLLEKKVDVSKFKDKILEVDFNIKNL